MPLPDHIQCVSELKVPVSEELRRVESVEVQVIPAAFFVFRLHHIKWCFVSQLLPIEAVDMPHHYRDVFFADSLKRGSPGKNAAYKPMGIFYMRLLPGSLWVTIKEPGTGKSVFTEFK